MKGWPLTTSQILEERAHRPFPLPAGPWVMTQGWYDLLFAHWSVGPETLRRLVPDTLELDLHGGQAWVGLTPFHLRDVTLRGIQPPPGIPSAFLEMNLRTYVVHDGVPGIFFFSLDAESRAAVLGARALYRLPYFHAEMALTREGDTRVYSSRRRDGEAEARVRYQPTSGELAREDDSLARWLAERYCLYAPLESGRLLRAHIHHPPWALHKADAEILTNTVGAAAGLALAAAPAHLMYAPAQHVLVWPPELVG